MRGVTYTVLALVLARFCEAASVEPRCPVISSCSPASRNADSCCTPSPGGLFLFRQRLQLDEADELGNWGIDGLAVLGCDSFKTPSNTTSPSYLQEEIASFCLKSKQFGGEKGFAKAEREWAQAETGEGVEELWERAWSSSGRYISTLNPECLAGDKAGGVPLFFRVLHDLHKQRPVSQILADHDITPSSDTTYSLSEIQDALGNTSYPVVQCEADALSSVSWPLTVKGKFQSGIFASYADLPVYLRQSNCPKEGIKYPSSVHAPAPKPSAEWDPIYRPKPRAITKPHDESKLYRPPHDELDGKARNPVQLKFFKGKDEKREGKEDGQGVKFSRDEL